MICSQNSTPAPNMVPCISQMCTAWFSSARSKGPGRCHTIIAALNRPTETQGRSSRSPSPRSGRPQPCPAASTPRVTLRPDRPGSRVQQRLPWRARDDQRRRGEHQQQVLDHVREEVVVGPVVDRRLHREQQHDEPGVEPQRPQPPLPGPVGPGPAGQPPQPGLVPGGDAQGDDQERVEGPVAGEIGMALLTGRAVLDRHGDLLDRGQGEHPHLASRRQRRARRISAAPRTRCGAATAPRLCCPCRPARSGEQGKPPGTCRPQSSPTSTSMRRAIAPWCSKADLNAATRVGSPGLRPEFMPGTGIRLLS